MASSLHRRRHVTPVSNVCVAAPISLFWVPNGLNELPEMRFEFPFNLIGKSTMVDLKGQSCLHIKIMVHTVGSSGQESRRCFAGGFTQNGLLSSVAQAM